MAGTIVADLPSISNITPDSYTIIERPGTGMGTYKGTIADLQRAITVTASVTQEGSQAHIQVKDINGTTNAYVTAPTARVTNNGDGTSTITITDSSGTTTSTVVSSVIFDNEPTQGSTNLISSGTLYNKFTQIDDDIEHLLWEGTRAQWDAMSLAEKDPYKIVNILDE